MGFSLIPKRGGATLAVGSKSVGSKSVANSTEESAGPTTGVKSTVRRPKKLFGNLTRRVGKSGADKKPPVPVTPSNTVPTARTPATTLMQHGSDTLVKTQPKPFELQYHDSVTHTLLEEQNWIRQQLFYAEEGVEVTAQFHHSSTAAISGPNSTNKISCNREREEEEKKEETAIAMERTPSKQNINLEIESPLPPTPMLDEAERDPVALFPAVAEAVAKAKEGEMKRLSLPKESTTTATTLPTLPSTKTPTSKTMAVLISPSPEKPFDEVGTRPEDPTIREIENSQSRKFSEHEELFAFEEDDEDEKEMMKCGAPTATTSAVPTTPANITCASNDDVTRQLLDVFQCGDDFTEFSGSALHQTHRSCRLVDAFYDNNTCWSYREAVNMKRPFYDETFAQKFLKDITEEGINVLWHLPPDDEDAARDDINWSGRSVAMTVKPGSCYSTNDVEPKLVWTTLGGGKGKEKVARCLVPLLAIQSVSTFRESICEQLGNEIKETEFTTTSCGVNLSRPEDEEEDVCLFSITTEEGDVQVFEAATPRERDLFVAGLKNVIARLSFHVIVGDAGASSELYYEGDKDAPQGELPSFSSPVKNMNRIAHALMD